LKTLQNQTNEDKMQNRMLWTTTLRLRNHFWSTCSPSSWCNKWITT